MEQVIATNYSSVMRGVPLESPKPDADAVKLEIQKSHREAKEIERDFKKMENEKKILEFHKLVLSVHNHPLPYLSRPFVLAHSACGTVIIAHHA